MSTDPRRTQLVLRIFKELTAQEQGRDGLRPGDINARLRELGIPMGTWEVRGEFSVLEASGDIILDEATANWLLAEATSARQSA